MKKIAFIFSAIALVSGLASCNKTEYTTGPFVVFQQTSYSINEDCGSIEIPISAYNIPGETTVAFNIGGSAVAGTDYTMLDGQTATLTFSEANPTQTLKFNIIWGPEQTGTRQITITAASATGGVDVPRGACKINIADVVKVDWDYVAHVWNAMDYDYPGGAEQGDFYDCEIIKVDEKNCLVRNLWGAGEDLKATVEFAADQKSGVLKIVAGQLIYNSADYGPCIMTWSDGASIYGSTKTFECPIDGSGIKIGGPTFGYCYYVYITSGDYAGYGFGDTYTELTN